MVARQWQLKGSDSFNAEWMYLLHKMTFFTDFADKFNLGKSLNPPVIPVMKSYHLKVMETLQRQADKLEQNFEDTADMAPKKSTCNILVTILLHIHYMIASIYTVMKGAGGHTRKLKQNKETSLFVYLKSQLTG